MQQKKTPKCYNCAYSDGRNNIIKDPQKNDELHFNKGYNMHTHMADPTHCMKIRFTSYITMAAEAIICIQYNKYFIFICLNQCHCVHSHE